MDDKRDALADYLDRRITITGTFEKFDLQTSGVKQRKTALLQGAYAEVEGKQIDLGRVWVQHAEMPKGHGLAYGDRIKCNCRVTKYRKRLSTPNEDGLMLVTKYSLSWPNEVEVIGRAPRPAAAPAAAQPAGPSRDEPAGGRGPASDPVGLILDVKRLADQAGGLEALRRLLDVLRGP
jgi:hypothetical protein